MLKTLSIVVGVLMLLAWAPAQAAAAGVRYEARLSAAGTSMKGTARYEEVSRSGAIQQRFTVEVQNAKPNASYFITAGGVAVGAVATNALGTGKIELRTLTDDASKRVAQLPKLGVGSVVTVGPISGTMVRR